MKKTLTVNLGGIVFNIDEDAYLLLDKYLANLRTHFSQEDGSEEIMNDFESRISEIFSEQTSSERQVISRPQVEAVIQRMGKVEELFGEDSTGAEADGTSSKAEGAEAGAKGRVEKRFFRNPDDKMLGGVCGGLAAYMGWDPTLVRLILFILLFFWGIVIPIYLILWMLVPLAATASERLQMRGESVTVESIGKTVTSGFEQTAAKVGDYVRSGKPRTTLQKVADWLVEVIGVALKVIGVLVAIVLFPILLAALFILLLLVIALIACAIGGGAGLLTDLIANLGWNPDLFLSLPVWVSVIGGLASVLLVGIPLFAIIYLFCRLLFKVRPLSNTATWILIVCWLIALGTCIACSVHFGMPLLHQGRWLIQWNS
ncbi:MAG: PspC domain-containing protein [Tannerella sp.]|jgi:phage shock protein PspC (stress-responsive transcriptional regulator)|nr:PspC domain-containing protein [Tannerella sp.]